MAWKIVYHDKQPDDPKVGDCWPLSDVWEAAKAEGFKSSSFLGANYFTDHVKTRAPLYIVMPGNSWFCVDAKASEGHERGWRVVGRPPALDVLPSIHLGDYHGYIRNGVITDDVDGRRYAANGDLVRV